MIKDIIYRDKLRIKRNNLVHVQTKVLSIPPGEYGRKAETQIIRRPIETSSEVCCLIR